MAINLVNLPNGSFKATSLFATILLKNFVNESGIFYVFDKKMNPSDKPLL